MILDPIDIQSGFEKVNIRTGIRGENWDMMLFGRNITDEITATGAADVPLAGGAHFSYMARWCSLGRTLQLQLLSYYVTRKLQEKDG